MSDGSSLYERDRLIAAAARKGPGSGGYSADEVRHYLGLVLDRFTAASTAKDRDLLSDYLEDNNVIDDNGVEIPLVGQSSTLQSDRATFLEFSDVEMDDLEFEYEGVADKELDDILKEAEQITYDSASEGSVTSETSETSETSDMNMAYDTDSLAAKSYDSSSDSSAQAKSYDSSSDSSAQAKSYDSSSDSSQTPMSYDSSSDMEI